MKVNVDLLLQLRKDSSWTQEELALASGLNLRTVQRIEKEASASLQSKKALASAFNINIRDLDFEEIPMFQDIVGKNVHIQFGTSEWSDTVKGEVLAATDLWLKLQVKSKTEFINLSLVSRVSVLS